MNWLLCTKLECKLLPEPADNRPLLTKFNKTPVVNSEPIIKMIGDGVLTRSSRSDTPVGVHSRYHNEKRESSMTYEGRSGL